MTEQTNRSSNEGRPHSRKIDLYTRHQKRDEKNSTFGRTFGFLNKVPWEKISIWAIFLFLLWTLRDFFTLILLTFVFTYIANTIVRFLSARLEVDRQPLTIILYLAFLGIILGPGHWFANRVIEQGQEVVEQTDTFFPGLQENQPTSPGSKSGDNGSENERKKNESMDNRSDQSTSQSDSSEEENQQASPPDSSEPLEKSKVKQPVSPSTSDRQLNDESNRRTPNKQNLTWKVRFLEHEVTMLNERLDKLKKNVDSSSENRNIQRAENVPENIRALVDNILSKNLGSEWMHWVQKRGLYDYLLVKVNQIWEEGKQHLPDISGRALIKTGNLLFTLLLAFLFSFFIVFDIPTLQKRLSEFEEGRLRDFYNEIAPSLANFGIVMGRSLQAQAMIAVVNTCLTIAGIYLMSIVSSVDFTPYLAVLTIIVFVCSFIPVLGVIISTIPIGLIGLVQGGLGPLLFIIVLILAIHGLETYVLNPNIYGVHMRMHPLIVLIVLLVAEHFFGLWGLVLGVPVSVYLLDIVIQQTTPEELFYESQT